MATFGPLEEASTATPIPQVETEEVSSEEEFDLDNTSVVFNVSTTEPAGPDCLEARLEVTPEPKQAGDLSPDWIGTGRRILAITSGHHSSNLPRKQRGREPRST